MKILALTRDPQFSPNSVEKDRAILMAVVDRLRALGHHVDVGAGPVPARDAGPMPSPCSYDVILSMGRLPQTLAWLKTLQEQGVRVINTPQAVELCSRRSALVRMMQEYDIPMAPCRSGHLCSVEENEGPYWLKRGDACAQSQGDIVFCPDDAALYAAIAHFKARAITDYVVSEHVDGDLLKFYGVADTGFFRCFYPTDDGQSKFGDEQHNGTAHHYSFDQAELQRQAERLAAIIGIEVYGGDAIIRSDGSFCIIDFNDWPSFSRCREEAAKAITLLIGDPRKT